MYDFKIQFNDGKEKVYDDISRWEIKNDSILLETEHPVTDTLTGRIIPFDSIKIAEWIEN